jgi:hypothetical protein
MRTGKNPAKAGIPAYQPYQLGVALILYIPSKEGYFKNSLEIFKYQVASLRASTTQPYNLLVIDNGSCPAVVAELHNMHTEGEIDWLVLSRHNMGKAGAWNWIFASMPNELICYADSDVLFRPGWLQASLKILEAFPQAGMIAAQPNFFDVMEGQGKAHQSLDVAEYSQGEYRPHNSVIDEYLLGIGADEQLAQEFRNKTLPSLTYLNGQTAVIGASHMQFLIPREIARQAVPLPATKGLLRTETMSLDFKIDELGYLHLSTLKPYVFHMGNTLSDRLMREIHAVIDEPVAARTADSANQRRSGLERGLASLSQHPGFKDWMQRAYNLLFRVLYGEN